MAPAAASDLVGYAGRLPDAHWLRGARITVNFLMNYDEDVRGGGLVATRVRLQANLKASIAVNRVLVRGTLDRTAGAQSLAAAGQCSR
jgi:hypothetical protein